MKKKTYTVYQFNELPEAAQKKALDKYRHINIDHCIWSEWIIKEQKEKLEAAGYENIKVLFSGFGSQGDGACFEATINLVKWLKAHKITKKYPAIMKAAKAYEISAALKHSGMYYHARMTGLEWNDQSGSDDLSLEIFSLEEMILNDREQWGNVIYKALENTYEYLISDQAVMETLIANEYYFTTDGEIDE